MVSMAAAASPAANTAPAAAVSTAAAESPAGSTAQAANAEEAARVIRESPWADIAIILQSEIIVPGCKWWMEAVSLQDTASTDCSLEARLMGRTVLIIEDDTRIANWVKVYFERAVDSSPRLPTTASPASTWPVTWPRTW